MLILKRRLGEGVTIGNQIRVVILGIKGNQVRLGIDAPAHTAVHRDEVFDRIVEENYKAAATMPADLEGLMMVWKHPAEA